MQFFGKISTRALRKCENAWLRTRLKRVTSRFSIVAISRRGVIVGWWTGVCMATIATCRRSWSWGETGFPGCIKLSINLSRYKRRGEHACSCRGTCICAISPVVNEDTESRRVCIIRVCRSTHASRIHGVPVIVAPSASWRKQQSKTLFFSSSS